MIYVMLLLGLNSTV